MKFVTYDPAFTRPLLVLHDPDHHCTGEWCLMRSSHNPTAAVERDGHDPTAVWLTPALIRQLLITIRLDRTATV